MRKLKLDVEKLAVETFAPDEAGGDAGTVRGYLTAYYELCHAGDTWQASCTCEPTCNARTCFNCPTPTVGCNTPTGFCCPINFTVDPTSCQPDC